MSDAPSSLRPPHWRRLPILIGAFLRSRVDVMRSGVVYVGGVLRLMGSVSERVARSMALRRPRMRRESLVQQMVRVGVRSVPIIVLVQLFIGVILTLNMAPTLESYGQLDAVANIVAIAVFRELGALITAIVLSGYAGASIAAELGTMVEGEEIKALRAHALDPIRFLVAPRVLATSIMMVALTILADAVGVFGGFLTAVAVLDLSAQTYIDNTRAILTNRDYLTGLMKAGVFGIIIAALASYEGLNVRGGAAGVGRATTSTVVKSIVSLIGADMLFTAVFYRLGW